MDKEQLLLEITRLEIHNKLNWDVIREYQESIQRNLKRIDEVKMQLLQLGLDNLPSYTEMK
jgi:hypothetical protein